MLFRRAAICCGLQVQLTLKEVHRNKKQEKKNGSYGGGGRNAAEEKDARSKTEETGRRIKRRQFKLRALRERRAFD